MKKKLILSFAFICLFLSVSAQFFVPPQHLIEDAPDWAQMMYADNPNVVEVTKAYRAYHQEIPFVKNIHTKNYKFWKRKHQYRFKSDGTIAPYSDAIFQKRLQKNKEQDLTKTAGNWSLVGPIQTIAPNEDLGSDQACVYTLDQSTSNPNIVFCGTEPGEVYKSTDGGDNWVNVSLELQLPFSRSAVTAIAINPSNANEVIFASQNRLFKSTNGGSTWNLLQSFIDDDFNAEFAVEKILFHPNQTNIVFVASSEGLFRSSNTGENWTNIFDGYTFDIEVNTGSDNTLYAVRVSPENELHEFLISDDFGASFDNNGNVWYSSNFAGKDAFSGRLAVSAANSNRIYAYLTGFAKASDDGYIGLFRSDDAGATWTSPSGSIDMPYSEDNPNLASGNGLASDFFADRSFCAFSVSNEDPDKLLIGGLNLWRSDDGGASFESLGGYIDGPFNGESSDFHVDQQEFKVINGTTWITNDGGIYKSDNFFSTTDFVKANRGVHSTDFWGFGSGWNKDVLIGGLFHNGVIVYNESYGAGNFMTLGGGEPSSGYVNPGDNNLVYSTDVGGVIIPDEIGFPDFFSEEFIPNESFDPLEEGYSDLVFHPQCYSVAYTAFQNNFWRTTDKGGSFELLQTFGQEEDFLTYIHISRKNPDIMYMAQRLEAQNKSKLWKSVNAGQDWTEVNLPDQIFKFMMLQVDPFEPENIWIASSSFDVPSVVFKSENGGTSWQNIPSPTLENEYAKTLDYIPGTNGGIYLGTNLGIYYKNDSMADWEDFSEGLPAVSTTQKSKPFYRDNKLRISTTKGLWESPLMDRPEAPFAQIMVDRIEMCAEVGTEFRFVDYSYLQHSGATWNWTVEGGTVSQNGTWFADVTFNEAGAHNIILEITDDRGLTDSDTLQINIGGAAASINILFDQENCMDVSTVDANTADSNLLTVTPNPSNGLIEMKYKTEESGKVNLKIFDAKGRIKHIENINSSSLDIVQESIDLTHLGTGAYWIKLQTERRILTQKIVIQ